MNVLIINGSPKGGRSNSLRLSDVFCKGISEETQTTVHTLHLSTMNISSCRGCFACWNKTPGKCCINDDMTKVIEEQLWADIIVWSFPLYYFSVPGILKNMIDRQLPMALPFMVEREDGYGSGAHPMRYDMSAKRHVLISTCGFYSADKNYDGIRDMFNHICGNMNYETIFCGQGELFRVPELKGRTDEYLQYVKAAGREFASGEIHAGTREKLEELLFDKDTFEAMADASWGIDKETGKAEDISLTFTKQMCNLYNKSSYDGRDRVLEICYTDLGKSYQLLLGKDGGHVYTDGSLTSTTKIETPWDVWKAISAGEIGGAQALAMGKYRVSGDLDLMMHWDRYFGNTGGGNGSTAENKGSTSDYKSNEKTTGKKPPVMSAMLIAWITFWVAVSIDVFIGSIISIVVCSLIPLAFAGREQNIFDRITLAVVGALSAFAAMTGMANAALVAGYLGFGLMWLISCLVKYPLCASYVMYNYGGKQALKNPIFMKTNYILALGWGILYIAIGTWSGFLLLNNQVIFLQILNNTLTSLMAIFTGWFQNWYPKRMMRGIH